MLRWFCNWFQADRGEGIQTAKSQKTAKACALSGLNLVVIGGLEPPTPAL